MENKTLTHTYHESCHDERTDMGRRGGPMTSIGGPTLAGLLCGVSLTLVGCGHRAASVSPDRPRGALAPLVVELTKHGLAFKCAAYATRDSSHLLVQGPYSYCNTVSTDTTFEFLLAQGDTVVWYGRYWSVLKDSVPLALATIRESFAAALGAPSVCAGKPALLLYWPRDEDYVAVFVTGEGRSDARQVMVVARLGRMDCSS
jgi:hypothetical protein